jgi:hypothetical protein
MNIVVRDQGEIESGMDPSNAFVCTYYDMEILGKQAGFTSDDKVHMVGYEAVIEEGNESVSVIFYAEPNMPFHSSSYVESLLRTSTATSTIVSASLCTILLSDGKWSRFYGNGRWSSFR